MSERNDLNMEREDVVVLVDDEGTEIRFEHLMTLEYKGNNYILLSPLEETEDIPEDEMVILQIGTDKDGIDYYMSIDDEDLVDEVFEEYLAIVESDGYVPEEEDEEEAEEEDEEEEDE